MEGYRVILDISAFLKDYRSISVIFINPIEVKTISDLKKRIRRLFYIQNEIDLFLAGAYIPSTECIGVIREGEKIVIRSSCSKSGCGEEEVVEKKRKKCKKRKHENEVHRDDTDEEGEMPEVEESEEHLVEDVTAVCSSSLIPKKKKRKSSNSVGVVPEDHKFPEEIPFVRDSKEEAKKTDRKKSVGKESVSEYETARDESFLVMESDLSTLSNVINDSIPLTKKRHSKRNFVLLTAKDSASNEVETKEDIDIVNKEQNVGTVCLHLKNTEHEINREMYNNPICASDRVDTPLEMKRKRRRQRRRKKHVDSFSSSTACKVNPPPSVEPYVVQCVKTEDKKLHLRFADSEEEGAKIDAVASADLGVTKDSQQEEESCVNIKENNSEDYKRENAKNVELESTVHGMETVVQNDVVDHLMETFVADNIEKVNVNSVNMLNKEQTSHEKITYKSVPKTSSNVNDLNKCNVKEKEMKDLTDPSATLSDTKSITVSGSMHKRIKTKGKKVVINKGMGVTLAHLMKENIGKIEDGIDKNPACPMEPIIPSVICSIPDLNQTPQKNKKDKKYKGFPVLEKYPKVGDILVFKILKLNHKYEPCLSDYIEGAVSNCNEEKKSKVTVSVIEGGGELRKTIGKFDLEEEEEIEVAVNDENTLELEWKEFVEPRLLFP